jgi:hypothetical protein
MEHERGAFKVNPAGSSGAVKKWLEIHEFHHRLPTATCCNCESAMPEF